MVRSVLLGAGGSSRHVQTHREGGIWESCVRSCWGPRRGAVAGVVQPAVGKLEEELFFPPGEDTDIPKHFVRAATSRLGVEATEGQEAAAGTVFHVGYALFWGAAYAVAREEAALPPLVGGLGMGALLYFLAFSRVGAGDAGGERAPPRPPPGAALAAHHQHAGGLRPRDGCGLRRDAPVVERYDAVVVGAGPNGLSAAIEMARAGRSVLVLEANPTVGGAARSAELTLPGFLHDPFSAVYPLGVGSPFFGSLPLEEHGLEWIHPPAPFAHPFDDGPPAMLERSFGATAATLGAGGTAYRAFLQPFAEAWEVLSRDVLAPLRVPRHPLLLARFGMRAVLSVDQATEWILGRGRAGALFAGSAAHAGLPLDRAATAAFGMVLNAAGHAVGWPVPRGGAGAITRALASHLESLGGEIRTGVRVGSLDELPPSRATFLNLTARQVLRVAGDRLPGGYRASLRRFRYGAGVFKVDWALSGPVPWKAPECARAGTVHLVGSLDELRRSEWCPLHGEIADRPFVLFSQPSLFDPSRAPEGKHTAWGYCHVPNGSRVDVTERIEAQVERFAPGFRDLILARSVLGPNDLELLDENLVGGDVNGGAPLLGQLLLRPTLGLRPYSTPIPGLYLCSASTPPGGAVHGMCGYHAARAALGDGY